jgi:hypothetical protein
MKKILISVALIVSFIVILGPITVNALNAGDCNPTTKLIIGQDGKDTNKLCYIPLEPGAFPEVATSTDLGSYLGIIFDFGIAAAVVLAFIMIIWGGIIYMTTDSWSGKEDGKEKIKNAIYGLAMALVAWLALWIINPNLVSFQKNQLLSTSTPQTISK